MPGRDMDAVMLKNPVHDTALATAPEEAAKMSRATPINDDNKAYWVAVY